MKWPESLMLIRHDRSAYNALKDEKFKDPVYLEFLKAWKEDPKSERTRALGEEVRKTLSLQVGDSQTPLAANEGRQAEVTGRSLKENHPLPHVVYVSPYARTMETLQRLIEGWPKLGDVRAIQDDRLREQEHGLATLYNDRKLFYLFHPEQELYQKREGDYYYRYPQGENVPDVRIRNHSWLNTLIREFSGQRILVVSHHLTILSTRANLERLDAAEFLRLDKEETPINCGVTLYEGDPTAGKDGRLKLKFYNRKYF